MEITEVRIKLMDKPEDRLRGFCSVTFDECFVIRDLKIIDGHKGPFVAMPSRKLTANCHKCRSKNHLKSNYCNHCGAKLRSDNIEHDSNGRAKLYADIAHPINSQCREAIQKRIVEELKKEEALSQEPGYRSRYDEGYDDRTRSSRNESDTAASHSPTPALDLPVSLPGTNTQAEVETRIDIPNPATQVFSPQRHTGSEVPKSVDADPSGDVSPEDDTFGKGVF
jgi:stage V sporulation protein G